MREGWGGEPAAEGGNFVETGEVVAKEVGCALGLDGCGEYEGCQDGESVRLHHEVR